MFAPVAGDLEDQDVAGVAVSGGRVTFGGFRSRGGAASRRQEDPSEREDSRHGGISRPAAAGTPGAEDPRRLRSARDAPGIHPRFAPGGGVLCQPARPSIPSRTPRGRRPCATGGTLTTRRRVLSDGIQAPHSLLNYPTLATLSRPARRRRGSFSGGFGGPLPWELPQGGETFFRAALPAPHTADRAIDARRVARVVGSPLVARPAVRRPAPRGCGVVDGRRAGGVGFERTDGEITPAVAPGLPRAVFG